MKNNIKIYNKIEHFCLKSSTSNTAITLVALVITIIVLLILTGVSLTMIMGEQGIFNKANIASKKTQKSQVIEEIRLKILEAETDKDGAATLKDLAICLQKDSEYTYVIKFSSIASLDNKGNINENNFDKDDVYSGIEKMYITYRGYEIEINKDLTIGTIKSTKLEPEDPNIIPEGTVAKIQKNYYKTLSDAIEAVNANNSSITIQLLEDVTENITIEENKNIILDLNEKTITNLDETNPTITLNGKLTTKNGKISSTCTAKIPTISILNSGTLELYDTNIERNSNNDFNFPTISLRGNIIINSGNIISLNSHSICGYSNATNSEITVNGGKISSAATSASTINVYGKIKVTGGEVYSKSHRAVYINENAYMNMLGGEINSISNQAIYNKGTVNINNGTVKATKHIAIENVKTLNIENGTIYGNINYYGAITNYGNVIMKNGKVQNTGGGPAIYNNGGTVNRTGGSVNP